MTYPWLTTISGQRFHLLNPKAEEVHVRDIAWSLGGIRRYLNHTTQPWTVAEHSIVVAMILRELGHGVETQLAGLFHDAAEAYLGDVPSPVKWAMAGLGNIDSVGNKMEGGHFALREIERRVDAAIIDQLHLLDHKTIEAVKDADLQARATETRDLLPVQILEIEPRQTPLPYHIEACLAYAMFIFTGECHEDGRKPADLFMDVYEALIKERAA